MHVSFSKSSAYLENFGESDRKCGNNANTFGESKQHRLKGLISVKVLSVFSVFAYCFEFYVGKMPCEICGLSARNKLCEGCVNGAKAIHALLTSTKSDNNSASTREPVNNSTNHSANTSSSNLFVSKACIYVYHLFLLIN